MIARTMQRRGVSPLSLLVCIIPGSSALSTRELFHQRFAKVDRVPSLLLTSHLDDVYGGDFAGHSATFSSITGALIPVPEHLLPASLIEWNAIPSCFEIITSEDILIDSNRIHRNIVTVIPEVGCGVDNLDTMNSVEDFLIHNAQCFARGEKDTVVTLSRWIQSNSNKKNIQNLETTFVSRCHPLDETKSLLKRTRVSLDVDMDEYTITTPIRIIVERQTSLVSSKGNIAKGGGLDGRTVAKLIGIDASNKPFSDGSGLPMDTIQKHVPIYNNNKNVLSLPGNIVIQYGIQDTNFIIHVVHLCQSMDTTTLENPIILQWQISNEKKITATLLE